MADQTATAIPRASRQFTASKLAMAGSPDRIRDHLANERTFLAWVRTAIGIVVFGFAIGRFGVALRQLAALQGRYVHTTGLSLWFGTASILFGIFVMIAAFHRYRRMQRALEQDRYEAAPGLLRMVAAITTLFSVALVVYLVFLAERMFD